MPEIWAIIPARRDSRRLSGKVLLPIEGRPLIVHVLDRVAQAHVQRVILATDDDDVARVGRAAGYEVVRTISAPSGTHRCWLAAQSLGRPDVIVNVQGDQPLLDPRHVDAAVSMLPHFDVGTVSAPLAEALDPTRVKVATTRAGRALYFSRSPIPHGGPYQVHVGIYAFSPSSLERCSNAPNDGLARSEDLEQLAWLEQGITIGVSPMAHAEVPVDDEAGLQRVRAILAR